MPSEDFTVWTLRKVCEVTGFTRQTIHKLVKSGEFPQPFRLGKQRLSFYQAEVEAWVSARAGRPVYDDWGRPLQ